MKGPSAQGMQNYACHCLGLKSYLERPGDSEYSAGKRRGVRGRLVLHHEPNSMVVSWLLILLALVIERLYRLRYLHRGGHGIRSAMELKSFLWINLLAPGRLDGS